MKNITILLPIHNLDVDESIMLGNALTSIEEFYNDIKLTIICPPIVEEKLKTFDFGQKLEVKILPNLSNDYSFTSQVNIGIDDCDTEWFTIMEIDDTYNQSWIKTMNDYIKTNPNVDIFLPIVKDINNQGDFISFTNESAWA